MATEMLFWVQQILFDKKLYWNGFGNTDFCRYKQNKKLTWAIATKTSEKQRPHWRNFFMYEEFPGVDKVYYLQKKKVGGKKMIR